MAHTVYLVVNISYVSGCHKKIGKHIIQIGLSAFTACIVGLPVFFVPITSFLVDADVLQINILSAIYFL
jgi:hypothetical protein